jgi:DNA-binding MarR family transcriptional regulator
MVNLIYQLSMPKPRKSPILKTSDILIGALLRAPAQAVHRRIVKGLNTAGFEELRLPHIAVFQYPGPDGARPGSLAERAGISKQAMNQLLKSLEASGYIERSSAKDEGRTRIVRLTRRGRAAYRRIYDILLDVEREWAAELGPKQFEQLKKLLCLIWDSPLSK